MNYLQKFQNENGLIADGKIGPKTLLKMRQVFKMSKFELSIFLGQIYYESWHYKRGTENMNYPKGRLKEVFGKYFENRNIDDYVKRPMKLANYVYDDHYRPEKHKLGNVNTGDGWKFRGHYSIQLTGRNNFELFQDWINETQEDCNYIMDDPTMFVDKYYWLAGIWYFKHKRILSKAKETQKKGLSLYLIVRDVTRRVQGGSRALHHRLIYTEKMLLLQGFKL